MSPEAYLTLFLLIAATAVSTLVVAMIIRSICARRKDWRERFEDLERKFSPCGEIWGIKNSIDRLELRTLEGQRKLSDLYAGLDKRVKELQETMEQLEVIVGIIDETQDEMLDVFCEHATSPKQPTTKKATK